METNFGILLVPFLILTTSTLTSGYCPPDKIQHFEQCAFRIHCTGNIRGAVLPTECQGSTNYYVTVEVILTDAIERFDDNVDIDFLETVTTLRANGDWPNTSLSFLKYMIKLRDLYLSGNNIKHISGDPFYHLDSLQYLDLSMNNLTNIQELFEFEAEPNQLRILSLSHNAIREMTGETFGKLTSLIELDLSFNLITDLTEEPFFNLTSLETLRLNNNRIRNLNGAVNSLKNLKHLYLRENEIQNIDDESLTIIYHLQTFDVSGNQLEKLKPILFLRHWNHIEPESSICKIILSHNQIALLPNATSKEIASRFIRDIRNHSVILLTELDLSRNTISHIEYNAFQTIYQLITLDLSHNRLIDFNVNGHDLSPLKYLNLSNNYLISLEYQDFYSMRNLETLDLSNNKLSSIPDETFVNNYNLRYLNLTFNDFKEIRNLYIKMFHVDGGDLDLSNNEISKLLISPGDGLRLNVLKLQNNNITDVSNIDFRYHSDLKSIDLKKNYIQLLDEWSLRMPGTVVVLDLSENLIEKINPSTFQRFEYLKTLRLGHNNLESIGFGVFKGLKSLWNLDLSYNKFVYLNPKVFMDLKSLKTLSLRYNALNYLDYNGWIDHRHYLSVYVEGNNLSCDWLGTALNNYHNGYSKIKPATLTESIHGQSLEGIPCVPKNKMLEELVDPSTKAVMIDERLLVVNQKILEALKEQTYYMKKYFWNLIQFHPEPK